MAAADAGGIPDMVSHGENGLLFDETRKLVGEYERTIALSRRSGILGRMRHALSV